VFDLTITKFTVAFVREFDLGPRHNTSK